MYRMFTQDCMIIWCSSLKDYAIMHPPLPPPLPPPSPHPWHALGVDIEIHFVHPPHAQSVGPRLHVYAPHWTCTGCRPRTVCRSIVLSQDYILMRPICDQSVLHHAQAPDCISMQLLGLAHGVCPWPVASVAPGTSKGCRSLTGYHCSSCTRCRRTPPPLPPENLEWGDHTLDRKQYIMLYCGVVWKPCSSRIISVLK